MAEMRDYRRLRVLGKGAYGKVYLAKHRREGKLYALKLVKMTDVPKKEVEAVRLELRLLRRLSHPNIVGYKESFPVKDGAYICIVMMFADGGELAAKLERHKKAGTRLPESLVLHYFVQIALGLHYMHGKNVLHRDIKTANIFMAGRGRLVLGDLGISKVLDGTVSPILVLPINPRQNNNCPDFPNFYLGNT